VQSLHEIERQREVFRKISGCYKTPLLVLGCFGLEGIAQLVAQRTYTATSFTERGAAAFTWPFLAILALLWV
jgi:hypothetical protein